MTNKLQTVINRLTAWGRTCGLTFNLVKTKVVFFTRTRVVPDKPIQVDGIDVPYTNEVKYLGLTLDSIQSWKDDENVLSDSRPKQSRRTYITGSENSHTVHSNDHGPQRI